MFLLGISEFIVGNRISIFILEWLEWQKQNLKILYLKDSPTERGLLIVAEFLVHF